MKRDRTGFWKPVVKVFGVTLGLILLSRFLAIHDLLHMDKFHFLASFAGWKGIVVLLLAGAITPVAFVPRWPLGFICGLVYGPIEGIVVASLAGLLGAALHYQLTAWLVSDRERAAFEAMAWFRALQNAPHPFLSIVALRLFPLSNFSATNLVCGLLRIPFGLYLGASALGMLPSTLVFVMAGKGLSDRDLRLVAWMLALAALLAVLPLIKNFLCAPATRATS